MKKKYIIRRLSKLAKEMHNVSLLMVDCGGEIAAHGKELNRASKKIYQWADAIEDELLLEVGL